MHSHRDRLSRLSLAFLPLALSLSACNSASHTVSAPETAAKATFTGKAMGGEQPITAATIQLYAVNTSTDGGTAAPLITVTITTSDGTGVANSNANVGNNNNQLSPGSFTVPAGDFSCPSPSALVYLAAIGGNPGGGTNNSQENLAALGPCGSLPAYININEVTTVGTVAALFPYMTAYNAIGSGTSDASALTAAFNTAAEYVDVTQGTAPGPSLPSGYDASSYDIRALANVVQACVNSTGGTAGSNTPCGMFFTETTPAGTGVAPTETVGALIDLFNNPTVNVSAIFNLQGTTPAFAPTYPTPPSDWTLPIQPIPGAPAFSVPAGAYSSAQSVTITDSVGSAAIYYTTDGSTPSTSSTLYSGPVTVTPPETLRAFAVQGRLSGAVASAIYTASVAPTVSVSAVSSPNGSTAPASITASDSGSAGTTNGTVVTFSVTGSATGTFSPATCTIANGSCSVSYIPDGQLAAGTYTNDVTASFAAAGSYSAASATSTLTISGAAFSASASYSVLASFTGNTGLVSGQNPEYFNLVQGSDGSFYGTTYSGGATGYGTVFKITSTGTYTLLHSFSTANTDGRNPTSGLVQGSDGNFYGTTQSGGTNHDGVVFKITSGGTFSLLHVFTGSTTDGQYPFAGLVQGSDGNFYGTTINGGANTYGTIFKITPGGTFSLLHSFSSATTDGENPYAGLVQGSDGNFYGTTQAGGANTYGAVFKMTPAGALTVVYSFSSASTSGLNPYGALVEGSDGSFYGTTQAGGANNYGTVFKVSAAGAYTTLHSFSTATTDGEYPYAGLVQGSDGSFYGTTQRGGSSGSTGAVFSITSTGAFNLVQSFTTAASGQFLYSGLVQGGDGSFYGATDLGGTSNKGAIFKLTSSPTLAAPVTLTMPASVTHGTTFTLGYAVSNAYSTTLQTCFATNTAGDTTGWTGAKTGSPTVNNVTLTAPATAGTYTYALTCGGMESGFATLTVQ